MLSLGRRPRLEPETHLTTTRTPSTSFSSLPTELQNKILVLTFEPRVVHLTFRIRNKNFLKSSAPIPAILHLSRGARAEALRHYKSLFGTRRYPDLVFFNPEIDTLYFGPVKRFGEHDPYVVQRWWWETEKLTRFKQVTYMIGGGNYELDFFTGETSLGDVRDIRFLGMEARAIPPSHTQLLRFIRRFRALEVFTISYTDKSGTRQKIVMNIAREAIHRTIRQAYATLDEDNVRWKEREYETEYIQPGPGDVQAEMKRRN